MPTRTQTGNKHSRLFWVGLVVLLIIVVVLVLELTGTTHFFHNDAAHTPNTPKTKALNVGPASPVTKSGSTSNNPKSSSDASTATGAAPTAPSGSFVSNHKPDLSGSPTSNQLQSICTTTAGASCTIQFSKGGTVKSLAAQQTDASGSTVWTWKLQDIGLTQGNWQITAMATLNGQTLSTTDQIPLSVGP